jgi:hypothetical protein
MKKTISVGIVGKTHVTHTLQEDVRPLPRGSTGEGAEPRESRAPLSALQGVRTRESMRTLTRHPCHTVQSTGGGAWNDATAASCAHERQIAAARPAV